MVDWEGRASAGTLSLERAAGRAGRVPMGWGWGS